MKLTKQGRTALIVAAGVVALVVSLIAIEEATQPPPDIPSREIQWERLESEEGPYMFRTKTPNGWLVSGDDGYLDTIVDPDHVWLAEDSD